MWYVISLILECNRYFILLAKGIFGVLQSPLEKVKKVLEDEIRINLMQNIDSHKAKCVTVLCFQKEILYNYLNYTSKITANLGFIAKRTKLSRKFFKK
jgi:hypothetical protein